MHLRLALIYVFCVSFLPEYSASQNCPATLLNVQKALLGIYGGSDDSCSCKGLDKRVEQLESLAKKVVKIPELCYAGVSDGRIHKTDIYATSSHSHCTVDFVALKSARAWCVLKNDLNQWVQFDLGEPKTITGVVTQGRANYAQWVTTYRVSYGNDPKSMSFYTENGSRKLFTGNTDQNTIVTARFPRPITARYIRIHPVGYHGYMSMRIELLEC